LTDPVLTAPGSKVEAGWPVWIATCAGIGYLPVPGTFGAAVGIAIVAAAAQVHIGRSMLSLLLAVVAAVLFAVGVWSASRAEQFFSRKDPGYVVIDEVVGQVVTFLARPDAPWKWLLAGFVCFRVLDVIKPSPARRAERLPGGWGIMTDDVTAGLYSLAALLLLGFLTK
jgi:phosphatidylglycerophosphatase A